MKREFGKKASLLTSEVPVQVPLDLLVLHD